MPQRPDEVADFGFLQMRPLVVSREWEEVRMEEVEPGRLLCESSQVLGNGRIQDIQDIVVVDFQRFERARSQEVARHLAHLNAKLSEAGISYLLIGVGRWGSTDPWLGIPVTWDQISGARVIVETGLSDLRVTPSQGSHFFQNLVAFQVGYFTINSDTGEGFVDWDVARLATRPRSAGLRPSSALARSPAGRHERQDQPRNHRQARRPVRLRQRNFRIREDGVC